jgi:hypothetical protein
MTRRLTLGLLAAAVLVPLSVAQPRGGLSHRSLRIESRFGEGRFQHHRNFVPRGYYLDGVPYFYADYPFSPVAEAVPQPVIVLETPAPAASVAPEARAAPLLIELQGDRYVRYGGVQPSAERGADALPDYGDKISSRAVAPRTAIAHDHPRSGASPESAPVDVSPAVLVYRDGHREEAAQYAIIGATLYAHGSDWQRGYWSKQVPLSALNLLATAKANQERRIQFLLPSAPNEIVTGP